MKLIVFIFVCMACTSCNNHASKRTNSPSDGVVAAHSDTIEAYDSSQDKPGLPVIVLQTMDASPYDDTAKGPEPLRYPSKYTMDEQTAARLSRIVSAYGVSGYLWLAPKGWTGRGLIATNGGWNADLFPVGGNDSTGPRIHYFYERSSSCAEAAPYFKEAMDEWNGFYNDDGRNPIRIPRGLKIKKLSSTTVTYKLPDINGLSTRGVAFYGAEENDDDEKYTLQARFTLPTSDSALTNTLLKWYLKWLNS